MSKEKIAVLVRTAVLFLALVNQLLLVFGLHRQSVVLGISSGGVHLVHLMLTAVDQFLDRHEEKFLRHKKQGQGIQQHKQSGPEIDADKTFKHLLRSSLMD